MVMSALNPPLLKKRSLMSVMAETSQFAMEPYFSVAATTLASYSPTAVLRLYLSANTLLTGRRRRWFGGPAVLARITDSHSGGHTPGCSTSATLLATFGSVTRVVTPVVM